jgi:hypothetical protein
VDHLHLRTSLRLLPPLRQRALTARDTARMAGKIDRLGINLIVLLSTLAAR